MMSLVAALIYWVIVCVWSAVLVTVAVAFARYKGTLGTGETSPDRRDDRHGAEHRREHILRRLFRVAVRPLPCRDRRHFGTTLPIDYPKAAERRRSDNRPIVTGVPLVAFDPAGESTNRDDG